MAAGWPTKANFATGDVLTATQMNDLAGTVNYIDPTSATDNQVLTRDAASPGKVKWAAAGGFDSQLLQENSGYYVRNTTTATGALGTRNLTADVNTTFYSPIFLSGSTLDRISIRTDSTFSGTSAVRLGLYNTSSTTGKPSTVVLDAGQVSCTAASTNYEITISQTVSAGWYYLAFNAQTVGVTPVFATIAATGVGIISPGVTPSFGSLNSTSNINFYTQASVTGAFATASSPSVGSGNNPLIALRIA